MHKESKPMVIVDNSQPQHLGNRFSKYPKISKLFRLLTWWLIFTGIYASSSICPFCGRAGCPVGGINAGIVGGFFALIIDKGKVFFKPLARKFSLIRSKLPSRS